MIFQLLDNKRLIKSNSKMTHFFKSTKRFVGRYKMLFMALGLYMLTSVVIPEVTYAQTSSLKITDLGEVEEKVKQGSDTVSNVAKYIVGAILALGLAFVIWALATNNPHSKDYAIGWGIAVVVVLVGWMIV